MPCKPYWLERNGESVWKNMFYVTVSEKKRKLVAFLAWRHLFPSPLCQILVGNQKQSKKKGLTVLKTSQGHPTEAVAGQGGGHF